MANTSTPVLARSLEGILALPNRIVPMGVQQSAKAVAATTEAANLALIRRAAAAAAGRADSVGGVNLYMGAGGTNFGFQAGANLAGRAYEPDLTSYDYDCPIGEDGERERERESSFFFPSPTETKQKNLTFPPLLFPKLKTPGHIGQRGIGGDGNKFDTVRAALLAAAEADADAARARLEAAEAEEKAAASKKHNGRQEVAAASASSSTSSPSSSSSSSSSAQRIKSLRKGAERAAADARFPDLPPPPPVVAFDPVELSLVGELLSDAVLASLAGVGGGGALLKFNSTTRGSGSGWSNGGVGAVAVPGPALPAMEALGQASGFVLYRATVPRAALSARSPAAASSAAAGLSASSSASAAPPPRHHASVLDLGTTVHDYGGVYIDGAPVAALDRASLSTSVALPRLPTLPSRSSSGKSKTAGSKNDAGGNVTLDILVHEMGRINFGCVTMDHKGLETDAVTLDGERLFFFFLFPLGESKKRKRERQRRGRRERCSVLHRFQATGFRIQSQQGDTGFFKLSSVPASFLRPGERIRRDKRERNRNRERDLGTLSLSLLTKKNPPPHLLFSPKQPPQKTLLPLLLPLLLLRPQPSHERLERGVAPQRRQVVVRRGGPPVVEAGLAHRGAQGVERRALVAERGVGAGGVVEDGSALAVGQRRGLVPFFLVVVVVSWRERERAKAGKGREVEFFLVLQLTSLFSSLHFAFLFCRFRSCFSRSAARTCTASGPCLEASAPCRTRPTPRAGPPPASGRCRRRWRRGRRTPAAAPRRRRRRGGAVACSLLVLRDVEAACFWRAPAAGATKTTRERRERGA